MSWSSSYRPKGSGWGWRGGGRGGGGERRVFPPPPLATLVTYLLPLAVRTKVLGCQNQDLTSPIPSAPLPLHYLPPGLLLSGRSSLRCFLSITKHFSLPGPPATSCQVSHSLFIHVSLPSKQHNQPTRRRGSTLLVETSSRVFVSPQAEADSSSWVFLLRLHRCFFLTATSFV